MSRARHLAISRSTSVCVDRAATNAIFTNAGGASTPATYTLTDPRTGRSRNVVVNSTGRVSLP